MRKKIIFYIDVMHSGGAQRVMSILVNYFYAEGYDVILVNDAPSPHGVREYEIADGIKRKYLANSFVRGVILKNIKRILVLRKIVKTEHPDVVLSFLGNCNKRMLLATLGLACKKIISVRNDPNKEYGRNTINKIIASALFGLADGVVFQTQDEQDYFPAWIRKKSAIICNPVRDSFFSIIRNKCHVIVTLGRLYPQKNHKLLIEAYEKISHKIKEPLYIYGEGPLKEELKTYIKQKKLADRILLNGNTCNVEEVLGRAKLFVLSSDYEGLPNALMEALASGTPCISTRCAGGGPETLIENGVNGVLVPCDDVSSMSSAILKLCQNDEYREALGKNAKRYAERFREINILKIWKQYIFS